MTTKDKVRVIRYVEPPPVKLRRAWNKDGKPFLKAPVFQARFVRAGALRYVGHLDPGDRSIANRLCTTGIRFRARGENIAGGPTEGQHTGFKSIKDACWRLFREPRNQDYHRRNLLHADLHRDGVGIAQNRDGTLIITQVSTD